MKILYIHGFGSNYSPDNEKIKLLETLGTVIGIDIDYCKRFYSTFNVLIDVVLEKDIDLIVGTSMGGYMAAMVGEKTNTAFISLNPVIKPSETLTHWIGTFTDYDGNDRCLTEDVVSDYPDITHNGYGLILVDSNDEILKANNTVNLLDNIFNVKVFNGGNHEFAHMNEAMPLIKLHVDYKEAHKKHLKQA